LQALTKAEDLESQVSRKALELQFAESQQDDSEVEINQYVSKSHDSYSLFLCALVGALLGFFTLF